MARGEKRKRDIKTEKREGGTERSVRKKREKAENYGGRDSKRKKK